MPDSSERAAIKQVGDEFFILSHLLRKYMDTAMSQSGVPLARSKLLKLLTEHGPSRVTDLAAHSHTAVRSATQAVDAKPFMAAYEQVFGSLSAEERATFLATLAKLRAAAE
jgi:hypothetical protein